MIENLIKKLVRSKIMLFGINHMTRKVLRHMPRIIMYHGFCKTGDTDLQRLPIDHFRKQLFYIKKHFSPLKISDLALEQKSNGSFPHNAVAITIDDGYEDF